MFLRRTVLTVCLMGVACGLCAFDLQYGSFFRVKDIVLEQGRPVLPLTRGKYADVRVLDRETFDLLKNCSVPCRQEADSAGTEIFDIRAALTRPGMWIAEVSFGGQWLVTFLIFQNKSGYDIKEPEKFVFLDRLLKKKVENMLSSAAARTGQKVVAPAEEDK